MEQTVSKKFVQIFVLDMEGRNGYWRDTEKTYEEAIKSMDSFIKSVRIVEKTFNLETFELDITEIKRTEKIYEGLLWKGKTREITQS